jgi:hypothetical protein
MISYPYIFYLNQNHKPIIMKKIIAIMLCAVLYSCGESTEPAVEDVQEETVQLALSDEVTATMPSEPTDRNQAAFDEYAWQLFVAMNWPASDTERGVPNLSKQIGDPGTVVWQSLRTSESVFLAGGADPGNWNDGYPMEFVLENISKVDPEVKEHLSAVNQAVGGPLTDQDSNYTFYEKYMNEIEYTYVHTNKFYDKSILNAQTSDLKLTVGSMEIKSAWKIMTENDDQDDFFTAPATVKIPDGPTKKVTVGLVGLHITMKTAGSPQWVWATFEHINNVPGDAGSTATHFSFNNPDCSEADCPVNVATKPGIPTQVTRYTPIEKYALAANKKWQGLLQGTVWANYELITMQWPSDPDDPGNPQGTPTPNISANTTMETYIQRTSSCMACHSTARTTNELIKTDYSFLFLEAQSSESPLNK